MYGFVKFIFLMALVLQCSSGVGMTYSNPSQALLFEVLDGYITVNATINGKKGTYIFDTGTDMLIINDKPKNKSSQAIDLVYSGGEIEAYRTTIENLVLGHLELSDVDAYSLDFAELSLPLEIDGIIGWQLFRQLSFLIDYQSNQIIFENLPARIDGLSTHHYNVTSLPMTLSHKGLPIIKARFQNQEYAFVLDTGAPMSVVDRSILPQSNRKETMLIDDLLFGTALRLEGCFFRLEDLTSINLSQNVPIHGIMSTQSLNADKVLVDNVRSRVHIFWSNSATSSMANISN